MAEPLDCGDSPNLTFAFDGAKDDKYKPPELCIGTLDYSTDECAEHESEYLASLQAEALNAAGGPINIFPMLGVHSQGSTVDTTSSTGYPLASGTPAGYNALDAFNTNDESWRSTQLGNEVLTAPAFIGYSFGTKKAWTKIGAPQERYHPSEPVRKQISSLKIKQGHARENRAAQVRVEASDDGTTWKRIDVVSLPDTNQLVTVGVRSNAAYNQWRLIPIFFNGISSNSSWEVVELHMLEATVTTIDNIQDFFLLENRDRAYARTSVMIKGQYDLLDVQTELARFGINIPQTYIFTVSFAVLVKTLGRPIVVGDVIELPGEVQYDTALRPVRKWLEVTDTSWATEGYAHTWKPLLYRFYAQPILPSVEHKDLLGLPGKQADAVSDGDFLLKNLLNNQAHKADEHNQQVIADAVPQDGTDPQDIMSGKSLLHPEGSYDGRDLYMEDAIPPDGAPYTTGDVLPKIADIVDGHYHRQTYTMFKGPIKPPDRLLRFTGGRWRVVEKGRREKYQSHKKTVAAHMANGIPLDGKP